MGCVNIELESDAFEGRFSEMKDGEEGSRDGKGELKLARPSGMGNWSTLSLRKRSHVV